MAKQRNNTGALWRFLLVVYCGIMLWLLFCRSPGWIPGLDYEEQLRANINLVPLYTIKNYLQVVMKRSVF